MKQIYTKEDIENLTKVFGELWQTLNDSQIKYSENQKDY